VLGDALLDVTATEIAHVLFTRAADWTFKVHDEELAQLLFDECEKSRVQNKIVEMYPGCREIFDMYQGEKPPTGAWSNPQVRKDFPQLPAKWRFILNINRVLRGMTVLGTDYVADYVKEVQGDLIFAVNASSTQMMVPHLERPYQRLLDAVARESEELEYKNYCKACLAEQHPPEPQDKWRDEGKPEGPPPKPVEIEGEAEPLPDDWERNENVSDFQHDPADEDDGKPGGEDGSAGMRRDGRGLDGPDNGDARSESNEPSGSEGGDDGGSGDALESDPPTVPDKQGGDTEGGDDAGPLDDAAGNGDGPESSSPSEPADSTPAQVKTGNVFRAMVEDLDPGVGGKAVKNFRDYFNRVDREAVKVEKQIHGEEETQMSRFAQGLGNASGRKTERVRRIMDKNESMMEAILPELQPFIRSLRNHAKSVIRENSVNKWGGSFTEGRKISDSHLYRVATEEEPRIFQRKTVVGARSYCIGIASDQSSSMDQDDRIILAGSASVIALEALDGLVETACVGFFTQNQLIFRGKGKHVHSMMSTVDKIHHYKRIDEPVKYVRPLFGSLFEADGSTPMGAGIWTVLQDVKNSKADVRAIILVSDGKPTDAPEYAFAEARRLKIPIDALAIGKALPFHETNCRHVQEVSDAAQIVPGFVSILRRIVRRNSAIAAA
jgi:hypothetical protein